jgi:hypothetical protein
MGTTRQVNEIWRSVDEARWAAHRPAEGGPSWWPPTRIVSQSGGAGSAQVIARKRAAEGCLVSSAMQPVPSFRPATGQRGTLRAATPTLEARGYSPGARPISLAVPPASVISFTMESPQFLKHDSAVFRCAPVILNSAGAPGRSCPGAIVIHPLAAAWSATA